MKEIHKYPESLNAFNEMESNDVTSADLYKTLCDQDQWEGLKEYCNNFKNIYYIKCFSFSIEDRKNYPGIYAVLQRYAHTADGRPLELIIWEYSDEAMARMHKTTEECREKYEAMWIKVRDPLKYQHFVGYYWGSSWRACQEIIKKLDQHCSDKITEIRID